VQPQKGSEVRRDEVELIDSSFFESFVVWFEVLEQSIPVAGFEEVDDVLIAQNCVNESSNKT